MNDPTRFELVSTSKVVKVADNLLEECCPNGLDPIEMAETCARNRSGVSDFKRRFWRLVVLYICMKHCLSKDDYLRFDTLFRSKAFRHDDYEEDLNEFEIYDNHIPF